MRRHPLDVVSLLAGLVFLGIAVIGLTDWSWRFDLDPRWLLPVALVSVGLLGLAGLLGRHRSRRE